MSLQEISQLNAIVTENRERIIVLEQRLGSQDKILLELKDDNKKMQAILNQAIGSKTALAVIGSCVVSVITWALTYFSVKR